MNVYKIVHDESDSQWFQAVMPDDQLWNECNITVLDYKSKIWWQVYRPGLPVFGFSSKDGLVDNKFPDYRYQGSTLNYLRNWCVENNARVVKISEQVIL